MKATTKPAREAAEPLRRAAIATRRPLARVAGGAALVGVGSGFGARALFGTSNAFVLLVVGYMTFVAVAFAIEMCVATLQRGEGEKIDLTLEPRDDGASDAEATVTAIAPTVDVEDVPMPRRHVTVGDVVEAGVAAVAAAGFAELLRIVIRMRSLVGVAVWWYVAFIVMFFMLARDRDNPETARDRIVTVVVWSVGLLVAAVLGWMVVFIAVNGYHKLAWGFFTEDLSKVGPLTPGGGAKHAIIGTVEQVGLATFFVVPIGILTAVYLHEVQGRMARPIRFIVDAMSGLPSIIAGLFIFTLWVESHSYSGAAGAAALVVLMLPTMTRATEEILRTVPDTLREGALALGSPQWQLVSRVVLPTALTGIVTAMLLAVARAIGETAPVLLTALGTPNTNTNPLHGAQSDLPLFVFSLIREPNKTQQQRAYTGAFVLVLLVFVLFTAARLIAARGFKKLGGSR